MTALLDRLQHAFGDRYRIARELGGGGMSHVFLATEVALGREVVLKVIRPELLEGLSAERFAREVQLAARLQQANIVPLLTAGSADGMPWFTMPFVRGESLRARLLREGAVPPQEAVNILRDVARALAYAHGDGVIHRDIKPENILLSGGTAVVADFGIAKALRAARTAADDGESASVTRDDTVTSVGMSVGTPAYMAPEQALGDPTTDHRADIYAWGVVAYELLTGAHPFAGRTTAQALIAAHISEEPAAFTNTPRPIAPTLQALVLRALAKEPSKRPASATELVAALDAVVTPANAAAPSSPASRTRWLFIASACALLAVGGWWIATRLADSRALMRAATNGATADTGVDSMRSIVVLPFENLGPATDAYFADGLSEEIGTRLAQIPGMRVVGRASVIRVRDSARSNEQLAREFGANYVLRGSVRWNRADGATRNEATVRIIPALVRVSNGEQLWGEPMTERLTDVFKVQADVAERVADALSVRLASSTRATLRRADTQNPDARDAALTGSILLAKRGATNIISAIEQFNKAIALDSNYARAWAGLAEAQGVAQTYGVSSNTSGVEAARRAITLDSLSADAWTAYAASLTFEVRLREALVAAERAVRLDASSAAAQSRLGMLLLDVGRVDEAEAPLRLAYKSDPYVAPYSLRLAAFHGAKGRADSVIATARRAWVLDPSSAVLQGYSAALLAMLGRVPDALETCTRTGESRESCARTYTAITDPAQHALALHMLALPDSAPRTSMLRIRTFRAAVYAHLGDRDAAFALLDNVFRTGRESGLFSLINAPWLQPLRSDPRWQTIVEARR